MIRDRIVCGMRDENAQRRLLWDTNLTLVKVTEDMHALEMAEKNM